LLNIGIVGMGKMGLLHASILNTIPGVSVKHFYDKSRLMRLFLNNAFKPIAITNSFEKFASQEYDAVYVTTPIPTHYSITKDLYASKVTRNVFVEKTMCLNYDQSQSLCKDSKTAGGVNMVGYISRFAPTFKKCKELLQNSIIGNPQSFKAYAYASDFAYPGNKQPRKGGAARDLGSHVIDLCFWFFGELEIKSTAVCDENQSSFTVRSRTGTSGEFDISWSKPGYRLPEYGISISGSRGNIFVNSDLIRVDGKSNNFTWYRQDLQDHVPFLLGASEYYRENEHFIKAIMGNYKPQPDFDAASKVDLLIEQVEQWTQLGKGYYW
jgi:scyllo-inositol 2-dehydrogenase (NADP+)